MRAIWKCSAMASRIEIRPNPRKTESIRRLGKVDIAALRDAVLKLPEKVWNAENATKPNRFAALDSTQHIVFRFVSSAADWRFFYERPIWGEWSDLLSPVLAEATAGYGYSRGEFPRVMLARMAPGGIIQPHQDANPAAKWPHKIHIPIETNDQVIFFIGGKPYHLPAGEAVEVNNMAVHGVENRGTTDRIHLIFEYFDLDQPEPEWIGAISNEVGGPCR